MPAKPFGGARGILRAGVCCEPLGIQSDTANQNELDSLNKLIREIYQVTPGLN